MLIASSDEALRRGLAAELRRQPRIGDVQQAAERAVLEEALVRRGPAVLLLDLPMRGFGGLEGLDVIRALSPDTAVIVLVESLDDQAAIRALKAGALGYCSRTTDSGLIVKAVQLVRQGEIWVGRRVMLQLIEELATLHHERETMAADQLRRLTGRQRQISSLITLGASNKEIAARLGITEKTVKAHLTSVFHKLGVSTRLQLAIYGLDGATRAKTKVGETKAQ